MIIDIPRQNPYYQAGDGDLKGTIYSSRNINLMKNPGKVRPSEAIIATTKSYSSATRPQGILHGYARDGNYWYAVGDTVYSTNDINGDFVKDTQASGNPTGLDSVATPDISEFSNSVYVLSDESLFKFDGAWSTLTTGLGFGSGILQNYGNRLYLADGTDVITSIDSSDVLATTSYRFALGGDTDNALAFTCMESVSNGIWMGTANSSGGQAKMFFWDGVTQNTAELSIEIESSMILSMTIKDDVPYILDSSGVLRRFNGSFFEEVARIDTKEIQLYQFNDDYFADRWVHRNGMVTIRDEIYIALTSRPEDPLDPNNPKLPAGIYAYNEEFGIYNKYSLGAFTETTAQDSYAQPYLDKTGAIFSIVDEFKNDLIAEAGDFIVSHSLKYDATTDYTYVSVNDPRGLKYTLTKAGVLVTTQIQAEEITDTWQKFVTFIKPMANSDDKIVVKYRTQEYTPVETDITWADATSFTSTDSAWATIKTNFDAGIDHEIEGMWGFGGGALSHVTAITEASGTYTVTIDETMPTNSGTATANVRIDRWNKLGEFTDADNTEAFKIFRPDKVSTWIQYKVYMLGEEIEVDRLLSKSKVTEEYGN